MAAINCPILMRMAAEDHITPSALADIVLQDVRDPALVDYRCVPNAGHFSFLSPVPSPPI
ncbi:hypothetical protein AA12717_1663 [Gluconacetobacter sacchari DSM 12717]|uniref:Uncharacterized protein n=1 Tax=Gluconacetobacter sacchari DSM 12717 TaxID=1307940 RepID=A0ABQ0P6A7_9PROT|nr:hypothetical protein AA12717_1663 [Gluconacetobacter sacchari DSM 12717]